MRLALPAPPVVTGFYRMLFASGLLGLGLALSGRRLATDRRSALLALASGACFGADLAFWNTSIVMTTVAIATLLVNTTPVYVGLYAVGVLRQRLHPRFMAGAALALAGTALLLGVPRSQGGDVTGSLFALTAGLFYAGYLLLMTAARRGVDAVPAIFLMAVSSTLTLGLAAWIRGDAFSGFPAHSWAAMWGAAVVSQLGGVLGVVWALRYLPATLSSVALLGQPVGTALLGWALLGEPVRGLQLVGGVGVLVGIALASQASRNAQE